MHEDRSDRVGGAGDGRRGSDPHLCHVVRLASRLLFGNEGTWGHSHPKYPWKTGERQRFLVTATPPEHGGFRDGFTRFGETFDRPATGRPSDDLDLPTRPGVGEAGR